MIDIKSRLEKLERANNSNMPVYLVTFFDGTKEELGMLALWQIATDISIERCFSDQKSCIRPYKEFTLISGNPSTCPKMQEIIEHEQGRTKPSPMVVARDEENKRLILKYPAGKEFDTDPDWIPL